MGKTLLLLSVAIINFSCAPIGWIYSPAVQSLDVEIYPSRYASDSDFLNLINDDRAIREQAQRNVFVYYNCLIKANMNNSKRQDPMIIWRSQYAAFSEIPGKIYQSRLERLADLVTDYNKSAIQSIVDREIGELKRIRWNDIQKEVNAIVTGARKPELEKLSCPVSETEMRQRIQWFEVQRRDLDQTRRDVFPKTVFLPPNM